MSSIPANAALTRSIAINPSQQRSVAQQRLSSVFWPARQLRRILREQAFDAGEVLRKPLLGTDDVHQARRCIKRARATLRLLRSVVGEEGFAREDSALKAAAGALDGLRDSEVVVKTIDGLIGHSKSARAKACLKSCRLPLQRAQRRAEAAQGASASRAVALLEIAALKSRDWAVSDAWYSLNEAIEQIYRRARRAYRQAGGSPDERALHALRKRTQYLRNALEEIVVQPSCAMERLVRRLSRLADLLGEDHDLAILTAALRSHRGRHSRAELKPVISMIEQRRAHLQARALKRAARLYRRKPLQFAEVFETQWHRWEDHLQQ